MNYAIIGLYKAGINAVDQEVAAHHWADRFSTQIDKIYFDKSKPKDELAARSDLMSFIASLKNGDCIVLSSLLILGWRVGELVQIIDKVFEKGCEIALTNSDERLFPAMPAQLILNILSKTRATNIEQGKSKLGRPKGSRSRSKYDLYLPQITQFLKTSRNISLLARELKVSRSSLKDYIASREL